MRTDIDCLVIIEKTYICLVGWFDTGCRLKIGEVIGNFSCCPYGFIEFAVDLNVFCYSGRIEVSLGIRCAYRKYAS